MSVFVHDPLSSFFLIFRKHLWIEDPTGSTDSLHPHPPSKKKKHLPTLKLTAKAPENRPSLKGNSSSNHPIFRCFCCKPISPNSPTSRFTTSAMSTVAYRLRPQRFDHILCAWGQGRPGSFFGWTYGITQSYVCLFWIVRCMPDIHIYIYTKCM